MMDYIRKLRLCIKWFQELEGSYFLEQEKLRHLLDCAERKCSEMGKFLLSFHLYDMKFSRNKLLFTRIFFSMVIHSSR